MWYSNFHPLDSIPPVSPSKASLPGGGAIDTIIGWSLYLTLASCVLAAVISGGAMALGSISRNPSMGERGKSTLIWSGIGSIVAGSAITLVNTAFGLH
jgi:hypothetical protein